jgi:hypothetical protein
MHFFLFVPWINTELYGTPETDMSRQGIEPVGVEHSSKELFEQLSNNYSNHLHEVSTWLPPVRVLHKQT